MKLGGVRLVGIRREYAGVSSSSQVPGNEGYNGSARGEMGHDLIRALR